MKIKIKDRLDYCWGNFEYDYDTPKCVDKALHDRVFCVDVKDYSNLKDCYIKDLNRLRSFCAVPFYVKCGDSVSNENFPILTKIRYMESKGVISNLNSVRHFAPVPVVWERLDTPWDKKANKVYWRGSTTGYNKEGYNRYNFVKDYYKKYDIGFGIKPHPDIYKFKPQIAKEMQGYVKNLGWQDQHLKNKYLPAVEGNDKSSSIPWILASSSVLIMPKPRYHSWLCEPWLEDGVHYVEVKQDWSDFDEKISWCKDNDSKCKEISDNATQFMKNNFFNESEHTTERMLLLAVQEFILKAKGLS